MDEDYLETHYWMSVEVSRLSEQQGHWIQQGREECGYGFLMEISKKMTDEFQEKYQDRVWDGEWLDTIDEFIKTYKP